MDHEHELLLQQARTLRGDIVRRWYIATGGPSKADVVVGRRLRDAYRFEHGDHQPDGRVIYRTQEGALSALQRALQQPPVSEFNHCEKMRYLDKLAPSRLAPLFTLSNDRH